MAEELLHAHQTSHMDLAGGLQLSRECYSDPFPHSLLTRGKVGVQGEISV